jgi:hypothetical protein
MELTEAQKETLKNLPRKTYTVLSTATPTAKDRFDALLKEVQAQAAVNEALGGPTLFKRIAEELIELNRRLGLALANKKHDHCGLCGEKWSAEDYAPVNDHGDCRSCARDQYGD